MNKFTTYLQNKKNTSRNYQKLGGRTPWAAGMWPCLKIFSRKACNLMIGPLDPDGVICKHDKQLHRNVVTYIYNVMLCLIPKTL
jgi:hypothetical protein